jgi:hypothetical protein
MSRTLFWILLILSVQSLAQAQNKSTNLSTSENTYFEIVGLHPRSVSFVSDLTEHIVEHCSNYLNNRDDAFPQRILVALRPETNVDFEGFYQVRVGRQGFVSLDFRWDDRLSLEQTCFALTEAFLTRYAFYYFGPEAPSMMRSWAVRAVGGECYLKLRRAQLLSLQDMGKQLPPLTIDSLLTQTKQDSKAPSFDIDSYCLLTALHESEIDSQTMRDLFERALAGGNLTNALGSALQSAEPNAVSDGLQDWWLLQRKALIEEAHDIFETMEVSREWIAEMENFDAYREEGGDLENIRALWRQRDEEVLQSMLRARRDIIALRLEQVNPAYYNAARSLGALYESLIEGEPAHTFVHGLAVYLNDFEDARRLQEKTSALLDQRP